MSFNAIVWDVEAKKSRTFGPCFSTSQSKPNLFVVGRVFLPNLTQVPATWRIQYRKRVLSRDSKIEDLLWSDIEPLHIFKPRARAILENEGQITLKYPFGETLKVTICAATTVVELRVRMFREKERSPMGLTFGGQALQDHERIMEKVSFGSAVDIFWIEGSRVTNLSAPPIWTVDFKGIQLGRRLGIYGPPGTRAGQISTWRKFHKDNMGLTMYGHGHCPADPCDSNVHTNCADRVFVQAKYGVVRMTPGLDKFMRPLCPTSRERMDSLGMFTPQNFNVVFGRALIRFKKCGANEPVKTFLMESLSATREYATFDCSIATSNYEIIEILTVGPISSPYYCLKCDNRCYSPGASWEYRSIAEVILSCGHTYHSGCLPSDKSCIVCASKLIENVYELVTKDDNGSAGQVAENKGHGYDLFSDFFPNQVHSDSIDKTACLKIAVHEFQRMYEAFWIAHRAEHVAVDEESE